MWLCFRDRCRWTGAVGPRRVGCRSRSTTRNASGPSAWGAIVVAGFALVMIVVAAGGDSAPDPQPARSVAAGGDRPGGRSRRGAHAGRAPLLAAVICAMGLTATVSVATDHTLQRPDWSAVARGRAPASRLTSTPETHRGVLVFQRNISLESAHTDLHGADPQIRISRHRAAHRRNRRGRQQRSARREQPLSCRRGASCNLYPSRSAEQVSRSPVSTPSRPTRVKQFTILEAGVRSPAAGVPVADRPCDDGDSVSMAS